MFSFSSIFPMGTVPTRAALAPESWYFRFVRYPMPRLARAQATSTRIAGAQRRSCTFAIRSAMTFFSPAAASIRKGLPAARCALSPPEEEQPRPGNAAPGSARGHAVPRALGRRERGRDGRNSIRGCGEVGSRVAIVHALIRAGREGGSPAANARKSDPLSVQR
jgi:hypothetical protein